MDSSNAIAGIGTLFRRGGGGGVEGTLLEGFETIGDWTQGGSGGSQGAEEIYNKQGNYSLKHTLSADGSITSKKTVSLNLSSASSFAFWIYIPDRTKLVSESVEIRFYTAVGPPAHFFNKELVIPENGWSQLWVAKGEFEQFGTPNWANITSIQVGESANAGSGIWLCWDDLRKDAATEAFTALGEVNSIGFGPKKEMIDFTHLSSPDGWREYKAAFKDGAQLTLNMNLTIDAYQQLLDDFEDDDPHNYQIILPDVELTTLIFGLHVAELPLGIKPDDKITMDVTFKITGGVEWA